MPWLSTNCCDRIWFRRIGQLWYELLDFHCNLSPEELLQRVEYMGDHQLILAMHPHGIVPYQALLWAAYCDQYFTVGDKSTYGFGAAADVVQHVPFLRNIVGFVAAGSASYKSLKMGLSQVLSGIISCRYCRVIGLNECDVWSREKFQV